MKLFGDSGHSQHSGGRHHKPSPAPTQPTQPAATATLERREKQQKREQGGTGLLHAPIWRKLRVPLIILACLILLALALVLAYTIWEKPPETNVESPNIPATVRPAVPEPTPVQEPLPTQTAQPEASPEPTEEPVPTGRKEDCYTFVLLVYDQLRANTDTILVGRMDVKEGTLDLVNIPRDTLVNVSWGVKKLNTVMAYEDSDPKRFCSYLAGLIGYEVDNYAVADLRAIEKLVDCIGGVYYNVPRNMDYDDPTQDLHIHISAGYQLLTGENAVKVLRFRMGNDNSGYANGDLGRIATQQSFMKEMAAQFLTLGNIPNLNSALDIVQTYVKTDLPASSIAFYVRSFLAMDKENIRFHTLPGTGISIRRGSYLQVNLEEWLPILNDCLNPFYQELTVENLDILEYLNSTDGATSTTGAVIPIDSFYDFSKYTG